MKIDEILRREDYLTSICKSLEVGWSEQFGVPYRVSEGMSDTAQNWTLQRFLSVFHTGMPGTDIRHFSQDLVRYTARRVRQYPQWLLGTARARPLSLRLLGRAGFFVEPGVPNAQQLLLLPGNRRHRVVDFSNRQTRVMLKAGFSRSAIEREVAVRAAPGGPFVALTAWGDTWFEEPLFDGRALNRWTDARQRDEWRRRAWTDLASWLMRSERESSAEDYLAGLSARAEAAAQESTSRYPAIACFPISELLDRLANAAAKIGVVRLAETHGDFQPGNVMVNPQQDCVVLSDWEYSGERARDYDFLVYALGLRHPTGVLNRLEQFASTGELAFDDECLSGEFADPVWRASALATAILEELVHLLEESLSGPFTSPPSGLVVLLREITQQRGAGGLSWLR